MPAPVRTDTGKRVRRDIAITIDGVLVVASWVLAYGFCVSDLFFDVFTVIVGWVFLVIRCVPNAYYDLPGRSLAARQDCRPTGHQPEA